MLSGGKYLEMMDLLAIGYTGAPGMKVSKLLDAYYKIVNVSNLEEALQRLRDIDAGIIKSYSAMNTTNNIVYKVSRVAKNGQQFDIKIRLNDECKNGHNDFSITSDIYEPHKPKAERFCISDGANGEEIAANFPEYAIFNTLNLCDAKGAPMHAAANGHYHLTNDRLSKEEYCEFYRVTPEQYDILATADDETHFKYLLYTTGVVAHWQEQANEGIALLQQLTGQQFIDDSVRYQLEPLKPEQVSDIEAKIASGYYTTEQRLKQGELDLKYELDKVQNKAKLEYNVKLAVLRGGLSLKNFIFYDHTNTGVFNWLSYEKKVTQEQFDTFLDYVETVGLKEVQWELK